MFLVGEPYPLYSVVLGFFKPYIKCRQCIEIVCSQNCFPCYILENRKYLFMHFKIFSIGLDLVLV